MPSHKRSFPGHLWADKTVLNKEYLSVHRALDSPAYLLKHLLKKSRPELILSDEFLMLWEKKYFEALSSDSNGETGHRRFGHDFATALFISKLVSGSELPAVTHLFMDKFFKEPNREVTFKAVKK